jgi:hypothetical protein
MIYREKRDFIKVDRDSVNYGKYSGAQHVVIGISEKET